MRRKPDEEIEFTPGGTEPVLGAMERAAWINLVPGMPDENAGEAALGTWFPDGRLGILHRCGRKAIEKVGGLPPGWTLDQDHVKRGLIVIAPPDSRRSEQLAWLLDATEALSRATLTGTFEAQVYYTRPPRSARAT